VKVPRWCRLMLCAAVLLFPLQWGARAEVLTLNTDPPLSYLLISGPVSLAGTAPLPIDELPRGEYGLVADGPGLVTARGRFERSEAGLLIGRPWAAPTALLQPPGLTHLRRGEERGWSFLGAGGGSAAMAAITQFAVRDAEDERDRAMIAYDRAVSEEDILDARVRLLEATQKIQDQEEVRNLWLTYLAAAWLGAGVEALFLTPQPTLSELSAEGYTIKVPREGRIKAALCSALVPGAGQRSMGRDGSANVFLTALAALGAGAITAHEAFLDARRDQAAAQRRFNEAEDEEELRAASERLQWAADRADDRNAVRWVLVGAAAGVYAWNVLDAFGLGHQVGAGELTWSVAPAEGGGLICATWSVR
jgi:hypothetical protein